MVEFRMSLDAATPAALATEAAAEQARGLFAAAAAAHQAGRLDEAERGYRAVLALDPRHAESIDGLGRIACRTARYALAAEFAAQAVALAPDVAAFHLHLGDALMELGRAAEAIAAYERALALQPDNAEAYANIGTLYVSLGRGEEARRAYEWAIALSPRRGSFYRLRALVAPLPRESAIFAQLAALAEDAAALSEGDRMEVHFALGTALSDAGDPARAFSHFLAGNALKRQRIAYDEKKALGALARIAAQFSRDFLAARRGSGVASRLPIFVVGMPRSGSTLVEQILASHPAAVGAGELQLLPQLLRHACAQAKTGFPEIAAALTAGEIQRLAEQYLAVLRLEGPEAARIVDKHLNNFTALGLIRLMLPDAKIIHVRRDPVDTCLSAFAKLFNGNHLAYTYELGELGRFYRGYARLMAHWRAVLPAEAMLEVRYEALVGDFEREARRIVDFCGLAWDERCRRFHETERLVKTWSALQVRQPLYDTAIEKWRAYGALAQPLIEALGDLPE